MADNTGIEWTDATWNPITGCTEVSPGCDNCYAKGLAERFRGTPGHYFEQGFDVVLRPGMLDQPLRWKRPRRIFVNSMSDLFHAEIPDEYIAKVFAVMALAQQHTFQILTKRHGRMRSLLSSERFTDLLDLALRDLMMTGRISAEQCSGAPSLPLPNVHLGVSVEDQSRADLRIPVLLGTPAAVRFLSCEPLLGPVDLSGYLHGSSPCETCGGSGSVYEPGGGSACPTCNFDDRYRRGPTDIGWVIVGGESGRNARPMHPQWARDLRDQCAAADVPFLFKQWGEWAPSEASGIPWHQWTDGKTNPTVRRLGKKRAGRLLDGRAHDGYPTAVA
jgi:protein gp37